MSSSGVKEREGTAEPTKGMARQSAAARALTEEEEEEEEEKEEEGEDDELLFPGGAGHAASGEGEPRKR